MTKFGWLVVLGVLLLIAGMIAIIYATFIRKPSFEERPEAIQEIVLPPVDETAATTTESATGTSTIIR